MNENIQRIKFCDLDSKVEIMKFDKEEVKQELIVEELVD